jgi:hypothetical protein
MDADRDAICALMERGLDDYFPELSEYNRAEALWGKWCDPRRVECPKCHGSGWYLDYYDEEYGWEIDEECPDCYGTGKVEAPTPPPPPPPPKSRYGIVNGGIKDGWYRVFVMKDGALYYECRSAVAHIHAWKNAQSFVDAAEKDE